MSLTPSNMLELGTVAPEFKLPNIDGQDLSLSDLKGEKGTLVFFICNHCPYVIHINAELVRLAKDYMDKGIGFVAINSNDVEAYPEDRPEKMKELAEKEGFPFAYLFDATQEVAKSYEAACTPDFYLFDKDMRLVYRGQLDGSRPGNDTPLTGKDMRHAFDLLLAGKEIPAEGQKPSSGCNIKWKSS